MGQGALALMADIQIKGGKELFAKMSVFAEKLREAAGRKAARRAMNIVRDSARSRLAVIDDSLTPEDIRKNVFVQQSRRQSRRIGGVVMRVGISGGARRPVGKDPNADAQPGGDTRHWRYVELGTEKVAARPFLVPALEQNAGAVLTKLTEELNKEIDLLARTA
jgi:HK97 gp10 family phage protein